MKLLVRFFPLFFYAHFISGLHISMKLETQSVSSPRRAFLLSTLISPTAVSILSSSQVAWGEGQDYSYAPDVTNLPDTDGFVSTESGLRYKITKEGTGAVPISGQTVKAHYTGWLDGFDGDKKFDSSRYVDPAFLWNAPYVGH